MADPTTEKHLQIKTLKCYESVRQQLSNGMPSRKVARFIQQTRGEYLTVKEESLVTMLSKFRREELSVDVLAPWDPRVIESARRQFSDRLHNVRSLYKTKQMLQYRLDVMMAEEIGTGKPDPNYEKTAKLLMEATKSLHQIQMDLGLMGSKAKGQLEPSEEVIDKARVAAGERAAEALRDPISRGKVLASVNQALKLADMDIELENILPPAEGKQ